LKKHWKGFWMLLSLGILLLGCGSEYTDREPEETRQTVHWEETVPATAGTPETEEKNFVYSGEFESTDGTVRFCWDLEQPTAENPSGAVDVIPRNLTREDAARIGNALFTDAVFYVPEEAFEENYSRAELEKKLDIWKQYTDPEKMTWLYGYRDRPNDNYIAKKIELVEKFLAEYTPKLDAASEEKQDAVYDWEMQMNGPGGKGYFAECTYQGIPYRIRSNEQNFSAYLYTGAGPSSLEEDHYRAILCRTAEPDDACLTEIQNKALSIAGKLNLGDWIVEECRVKSTDMGKEDRPQWEHTVHVALSPSFAGMPTISWGMRTGWTQEGMEFVFAPGGELLSFSLEKSFVFDGIVEQEIKIPEELLPLAQEELKKQTGDLFGIPEDYLVSMEQEHGEKVICKVTITTMKYGLAETAHPTHAGKRRFQPAMLLYGSAEYVGEQSGTVYLSDRDYYGPDTPARRILSLNAQDGSILEYPQ